MRKLFRLLPSSYLCHKGFFHKRYSTAAVAHSELIWLDTLLEKERLTNNTESSVPPLLPSQLPPLQLPQPQPPLPQRLSIQAQSQRLSLSSSSSLPRQQTGRKVPTGLLSQFFRGLKSQNMDQIWPLYSTLYEHQLHTRLTRSNYQRLVQIAAQSPKTQKNLHRLLALMEDMQQLAIPLRLSDYNTVMYWVGGTVPERRPRHLTEALRWLSLMEQHVAPCVVTYNTLIHIAAQTKDVLTAQRLYHAMLAKGIEADTYTYTTLLHSMATMGDAQGVHDMVARLEQKGLGQFLQHTVTWNMLIDCYYTYGSRQDSADCDNNNDNDNDTDNGDDNYEKKANGMFSSMLQALRQQQQQQQQQTKDEVKVESQQVMVPKADEITIEIHMRHLLRQQRQEEGMQLLADLPRHSLQPTLNMYHLLFSSFMDKDTLSTATDVTTVPDTSILPAIVSATSTASAPCPPLRQLYQSMQQADIRPTSETLYTLINALLDQGDLTFALETFVHLCDKEKLSPRQQLLDRLQDILQQHQVNRIDKE